MRLDAIATTLAPLLTNRPGGSAACTKRGDGTASDRTAAATKASANAALVTVRRLPIDRSSLELRLDPTMRSSSGRYARTTLNWYAPQRNEARPPDQSFTWPGRHAEAIGPTLAEIVRQADDVGFDSIWVMDHFFQIRGVGQVEDPMLEGWTTLGFMAAHSQRARLGLMVGGVHYRYPGLWVKAATTLDVLSGGRAWLGHRRRLERGRVARRSGSRSRPSASGSRCSRRRSRSRTGCGRASAAPRRRSTAGCSRPSGCSTPRSRCHAPGSRS